MNIKLKNGGNEEQLLWTSQTNSIHKSIPTSYRTTNKNEKGIR